jgi:hypothetical protein
MTVLARSGEDDARLLMHTLDFAQDVWSWDYIAG